ncbi:MFS transporter, partial [Mesorhizobium sp. M2E.F.Ca.ET.166.01.1.1]
MSGWMYDLTGSYVVAFLNGIAWNLVNLAAILLLVWRASRSAAAVA